MKSRIAYLIAVLGYNQRGSIDAYVTKAVMIFLAVVGAVMLLTLNTQLFGWIGDLIGSLTTREIPK